jgi:prolyl-tRNA synthetase
MRNVKVVADESVLGIHDGITGANRTDVHLQHVVPGRDFEPSLVADLATVYPGAPCPRCAGGKFEIRRGIEVGHVFKLGTKYSEKLNARVLDSAGKPTAITMGCYGIGIGRTVAAAIEQNHDDRGPIWPVPLAPFVAAILPLDMKNGELVAAAEHLHDSLSAAGIDVFLDDRDERPGVKFADAELLGVPLRVVFGKRTFEAGQAELVRRSDASSTTVPIRDLEFAVRAAVATQ